MHRHLFCLLTCLTATLVPASAGGQGALDTVFAVVANGTTSKGEELRLSRAMMQAAGTQLSFVVMQGVKHAQEPCTDQLYQHRRMLLDMSAHPLMLSMTGDDWTGCTTRNGKSAAPERLQRLREIFFPEHSSLGASRLALQRQSMIPGYSHFPENARWESGPVLFATINLPAPNNYWQADGSRKSEFEDRLVANTDWLKRVFRLAQARKLRGIVLFTDADVMASPDDSLPRDGFQEVRALIQRLVQTYNGKLLVVSHQSLGAPTESIRWKDGIGMLSVPDGQVHINVSDTPELFRLLPVQLPAQEDSGSFFLD